MLRGLVLSILAASAAVLILPFVASSVYIDSRGIIIPGAVYSKREFVTLHYSTWKTSSEVSVQYSKPDGSGVAFLGATLLPDEYDALRMGQQVNVRYLRAQDVPDIPLSRFFRRAQLLPVARLASRTTFSPLKQDFSGRVMLILTVVLAVVSLLCIWKLLRIPGFSWILVCCVLAGAALTIIGDFPRPTPEPANDVRQASGQVRSLNRISRLFNGNKSIGIDAEQPMDVVGVEFTPEGRTERVLFADIIDAGSVPGLRENSSLSLEYENAQPRVAHIQGASRHFVSRNIKGAVEQGVLCLVVVVVLVGGWQLLRYSYKRLTN